MSLPPEIILQVFEEIIENERDGELDGRLGRGIRVSRFRAIARVCKSWVHIARAAFWAEVKLTRAEELAAFGDIINDPAALPNSIRRLHFLMPGGRSSVSSGNDEALAYKIEASFPSALRRLQGRLLIFEVHIVGVDKCSMALHVSLERACSDEPQWRIPVNNLSLPFRPDGRELSRVIGYAQNVTQLQLGISPQDNADTFTCPLLFTRLESFNLSIRYTSDIGTTSDHIPAAMRALVDILKPACSHLRTFRLLVLTRDDTKEHELADTLQIALSLVHPTLHTLLVFVVRSLAYCRNLVQTLINRQAFMPAPRLQQFTVYNFPVAYDIFQQMKCSDLKELRVSAAEGSVHKPDEILAIMHSSELLKLNSLTVHVHRRPSFRAWSAVETFCDTRSIKFTLNDRGNSLTIQ